MSATQNPDSETQRLFQKCKVVCVPLLGNSLLTQSSIPEVSKLLSDLLGILRDIKASGHILTPSLISYVFYPLSTILRRNSFSTVPDQLLEKVLQALAILCDYWWWNIDEKSWDQVFMLCGAILGGLDGKGKGKDRDDATREAAAECLWSLLRERSPTEETTISYPDRCRSAQIFAQFQLHAQDTKFIPVLGQTLNSLLITAEAPHLPLQKLSLSLIHVLIQQYLPHWFVPSVMPGVVSAMCKIALGVRMSKGWANGDIVAAALLSLQDVIVRSCGNDICIKEGAIREVQDLQDLTELNIELKTVQADVGNASPFMTARTPSWLRGTSSQLHIAMNTLTPLVNHPTPSACIALCSFCQAVLLATTLTIPQSQPLLLSFLLSLRSSTFESVSNAAGQSLVELLAPPSPARYSLLPSVLQISRDNLSALPRLLVSHSDAKVQHAAGIVESVCGLANVQSAAEVSAFVSISAGVGKLLGPNGDIEKWGWGLLSALEIATLPVTVTQTSVAQLMLETTTPTDQWVAFPEIILKHVSSRSTHFAIQQMLRALGSAAGEDGLFSIEWFFGVGQSGRSSKAVSALWCACRILEGVSGVSLDSDDAGESILTRRSKRLDRLVRGLARSLAESWDDIDDRPDITALHENEVEGDSIIVEHRSGLVPIRTSFNTSRGPPNKPASTSQPSLHTMLSLQLLAIISGILQARFAPLLLHTLYPVLHSVVSPIFHVSTSALATLNFISRNTSYASPANLLLSNFDYALDAVSRRLTRRWLDVDATKVLVVLVRLVGHDVVDKAGDVVEECFDRLDEYHGYEILVEGLVKVLGEVVKVIEDNETQHTNEASVIINPPPDDSKQLDNFCDWFAHRNEAINDEAKDTNYGPFPREAWVNHTTGQDNGITEKAEDPNAEPPSTPTQLLTKQIVSRSLYFLTHGSAMIRARILTLLSAAVPVLPESALLPSIHHAWPFILNRLADPEPFVVSSAASLVESLALHVGGFMSRRIWDDIWPRFRTILAKLDAADATSALARRGPGAVGTESAYTHSHRLYRSLLRTMTAAVTGVQTQDSSAWEVIVAFRRFLHIRAHEELQACARDLYTAIQANNADAVWLALHATQGQLGSSVSFMKQTKWDIGHNVALILI